MDECEVILQKNELSVYEENSKIFDKFLNEFMSTIGINFTFAASDPQSKVLDLKEQYIYTSKHCELFFQLLEKYGYNMIQEIKDAFFNLNRLENPADNSEMIRKFLNSPVIQDISFDNRGFTITSEQYGKFTSEMASYVFRKNKEVLRYIDKEAIPQECHTHTYCMSSLLDDFYAITSMCKRYFKGSYYHSYTYDSEENKIIDLCSKMVMDKDMYYRLFQPQEVSVILNSNVDEELNQVKSKLEWFYGRYPLLKIALYKQYLESIGYIGNLKDGPSLIKSY